MEVCPLCGVQVSLDSSEAHLNQCIDALVSGARQHPQQEGRLDLPDVLRPPSLDADFDPLQGLQGLLLAPNSRTRLRRDGGLLMVHFSSPQILRGKSKKPLHFKTKLEFEGDSVEESREQASLIVTVNEFYGPDSARLEISCRKNSLFSSKTQVVLSEQICLSSANNLACKYMRELGDALAVEDVSKRHEAMIGFLHSFQTSLETHNHDWSLGSTSFRSCFVPLYFSFSLIQMQSSPETRSWIHPLHFAAVTKDLDLIESLFSHGVKRKQPVICSGFNAVQISSLLGHVDVLLRILRGFGDLASVAAAARDRCGLTAAHFACLGIIRNDGSVVRAVLDCLGNHGCNCDIPDGTGKNCLMLLATLPRLSIEKETEILELCQYICENLSSLESLEQTDNAGNTILHHAILSERFEILSLALKSAFGRDSKLLNTCNQDGSTALILACERNLSALVKLLLDSGANQAPRLSDGNLPIHVAIESGSVDVLRVLIDYAVSHDDFDEVVS